MANVFSDNYKKFVASPPQQVASSDDNGRSRVIIDGLVASGVAASGTITLLSIPKNHKVVDCVLTTANLGNGTSISVGTSDMYDRFITSVVTSNKVSMLRMNNANGFLYKPAVDTPIKILNGGTPITGRIDVVLHMIPPA